MARQLRMHVPGGFYHVTLRGNHRQPIFFAVADRQLLDCIVGEVVAAHGARVHAYCWMTNHLHALVQVSDEPLGRVVMHLASRYARTVQARIATTGHLFERRYHSVLVDADNYLLTLLRYIHFNPVRAGLVSDPVMYPWSSHRTYLGLVSQSWVTTHFAMNLLGREPGAALVAYRRFMLINDACRWGKGSLALNRSNNRVLGDDLFVARVNGRRIPHRSEKSLDELMIECAKHFGCAPEMIASCRKYPTLVAARAWFAHEAIAGRIASICSIARRLNRDESSIRELLARHPRATPADDLVSPIPRPGTK